MTGLSVIQHKTQDREIGQSAMIDRLQEYWVKLLKAGKLLVARAVARCNPFAKQEKNNPNSGLSSY